MNNPFNEIDKRLINIENMLLVITSPKNNSSQNQDELLTRTETADLLKISLTTLWHWTKKGKLKAYSIGNRIYYKSNDLQEALLPTN